MLLIREVFSLIVPPQTTHDKVKKRIMQLLKKWSVQFKKDETLGIVEETYDQLKKTCQWKVRRRHWLYRD